MLCCMQESKATRMTLRPGWFAVALFAAGACAGAPILETQLTDAVKNGDAATVRSLIAKKADVNAAAADSSTPLLWAVENNNLQIAELLIAAGANVSAATRYKIMPLTLAAEHGNAAMIERLLKAGADPNST